jgi:hypothetical protein
MRIYVRVVCAVLPILVGVALGETTVAAMEVTPASDAFIPPPQQQDRYAMGQSWAQKHHPEDADACPAIDQMFQSGCIAATRY